MSKLGSFAFLSNESLEEVFSELQLFYIQNVERFEVNHYLTRRLGLIAMFMFMFGLLVNLGEQVRLLVFEITPILSTRLFSDLRVEWVDVVLISLSLLMVVFNGIASTHRMDTAGTAMILNSPQERRKLIDYKKFILRMFVYVLAIVVVGSVLVFPRQDLASHFIFWGALGGFMAFFINRKMGYTRAWSRNRLAFRRVQILYAKWKLGLETEDNARWQLLQLVEENVIIEQQDIVNDYMASKEGMLALLKRRQ